jgi:hypothetical protein
MHLAAFVNDVAAADHRLTVHADDATAELRATLADALPGAAVVVEPARGPAPAEVGRLDDGALVLRVGSAGRGDGLVLGPDCSLDRPTSNPSRRVGAVDETTFTFEGASRALLDAAARGVASLADGVDTLHLGLGQTVGSQAALAGAADGTVHVYGDDDAARGAVDGATRHAAVSGELAESRFAVVDAADPGRGAALLGLSDDAGYRGFLSVRTALVEDLAGYLDRRYARGRSGEARARHT